MRHLLALCLVLSLGACKTLEQRLATVQLGASAATYGSLRAMRADRNKAQGVIAIALSVKSATAGGVIDWTVIQQQVLAAIQANFSAADQPIVMALASQITALIQATLPSDQPPSTILMYINAGASGAVDGATFYIASITPPSG